MKFARIAMVASLGAASLAVSGPHTSAHAAPAITRATKVFMVADSVGLGARWAVPKAFPANWSVTVTGKAGLMTDQLMRWYVSPQLTANTYDNAIVATGYNYPYWDPARFQRMVDDMVNLMVSRGVQHIYWVTVREVSPANYSGWNGLTPQYQNLFRAYPAANSIVKKATARHPELSVIDWAAISDQRDITADGIHLTGPGITRYSTLVRDIVVGGTKRLAAGTTTRFHPATAAVLPAEATAVSLQVSIDNPRTAGGITVWPCTSPRPLVANVNWAVGEAVSAPLIAPLDELGDTCLWQSADARLSVRLTGAFTPSAGYLYRENVRTLAPLTGPATSSVSLIADAVAPTTVLVEVTGAAGRTPLSYWVFSCGTTQAVPTVTVYPRGTSTALALIQTNSEGAICVRSNGGGKASITVVGTFDDSGASATAVRVFDSRTPLVASRSITVQVSGVADLPTAGSFTGALAAVTVGFPADPGRLTAGACPASINSPRLSLLEPHHPRSASVLAPIDGTTGHFCLTSSAASTITVDVLGTFLTGFAALPPTALRNG